MKIMSRKYIGFLFFALFMLFGFDSICQKDQIISYYEEMNKVFAKNQTIKTVYQIKISENNQTLHEYSQTSFRHNNLLLIDALNTHILINKKYFIKADHNNKLLVVETNPDIVSSNKAVLNMSFDSTFINIDKVLAFKKTSSSISFSYTTTDNETVTMTINGKTFIPDKVKYTYRDVYSGDIMVVDIVFSHVSFDDTINLEMFSEKQFIQKKGNKIAPVEKYKNYNFILIKS
jgi:hypothetical protein